MGFGYGSQANESSVRFSSLSWCVIRLHLQKQSRDKGLHNSQSFKHIFLSCFQERLGQLTLTLTLTFHFFSELGWTQGSVPARQHSVAEPHGRLFLSLESFDFHFSLDFMSRVECFVHLVSILFIRSLDFKCFIARDLL